MRKNSYLKPGALVLEVGCGRGAGAGLILKEFQPAVLQAMDLDIEMIGKAEDYLSPEQGRRISFYVGDVLRLPYKDGALDAVFAFGVLHHVPDWEAALWEIARVLKTGGNLFPRRNLSWSLSELHYEAHPPASPRKPLPEPGSERGNEGSATSPGKPFRDRKNRDPGGFDQGKLIPAEYRESAA